MMLDFTFELAEIFCLAAEEFKKQSISVEEAVEALKDFNDQLEAETMNQKGDLEFFEQNDWNRIIPL